MKNKRRDRRLMKQARKAASTLTTEKAAPKISVPPEKDTGPQKKETPPPLPSLKRKRPTESKSQIKCKTNPETKFHYWSQ